MIISNYKSNTIFRGKRNEINYAIAFSCGFSRFLYVTFNFSIMFYDKTLLKNYVYTMINLNTKFDNYHQY